MIIASIEMLNAGAARSESRSPRGTHHRAILDREGITEVAGNRGLLSGRCLPAMGSTWSYAWTIAHCRVAVQRCG